MDNYDCFRHYGQDSGKRSKAPPKKPTPFLTLEDGESQYQLGYVSTGQYVIHGKNAMKRLTEKDLKKLKIKK